jgi:O-acetyl-ADP-ribose deacetylase (regulator of RNase III)
MGMDAGPAAMQQITNETQWALFLRAVVLRLGNHPAFRCWAPGGVGGSSPASLVGRLELLQMSEGLQHNSTFPASGWKFFGEANESLSYSRLFREQELLEGLTGQQRRRLDAEIARQPDRRMLRVDLPWAIAFDVGEWPSLPLFGRHFFAFRSKVSGSCHDALPILREVNQLLHVFFPGEVKWLNDEWDNHLNFFSRNPHDRSAEFYATLSFYDDHRRRPEALRCAMCDLPAAGSPTGRLTRCSVCNLAWYCNRDCQRSHWGSHKRFCATKCFQPDESVAGAAGKVYQSLRQIMGDATKAHRANSEPEPEREQPSREYSPAKQEEDAERAEVELENDQDEDKAKKARKNRESRKKKLLNKRAAAVSEPGHSMEPEANPEMQPDLEFEPEPAAPEVPLVVIRQIQLGAARLCVSSGSAASFGVGSPWPRDKVAVVNAANRGGLRGGGVDAAIVAAGGLSLAADRKRLPILPGTTDGARIRTGGVESTGPGDYGMLHGAYVLHAVGPDYRGRDAAELAKGDRELRSAYEQSMRLACRLGVQYVGFSLLSTGYFRGPRSVAALLSLALEAVSATIYAGLREVHLIAFTDDEIAALEQALEAKQTAGALRPSTRSVEVRQQRERTLSQTASTPTKQCKHGARCRLFICGLSHPAGRSELCRFNSACREFGDSEHCRLFLHPPFGGRMLQLLAAHASSGPLNSAEISPLYTTMFGAEFKTDTPSPKLKESLAGLSFCRIEMRPNPGHPPAMWVHYVEHQASNTAGFGDNEDTIADTVQAKPAPRPPRPHPPPAPPDGFQRCEFGSECKFGSARCFRAHGPHDRPLCPFKFGRSAACAKGDQCPCAHSQAERDGWVRKEVEMESAEVPVAVQAVIDRLYIIVARQHQGSLRGNELSKTLYKEMPDAQARIKTFGKVKKLCEASGGRLRFEDDVPGPGPGTIVAQHQPSRTQEGALVAERIKTQAPPGVGYRCMFCAAPGGNPGAHWHQNCPQRPRPVGTKLQSGNQMSTIDRGHVDSDWSTDLAGSDWGSDGQSDTSRKQVEKSHVPRQGQHDQHRSESVGQSLSTMVKNLGMMTHLGRLEQHCVDLEACRIMMPEDWAEIGLPEADGVKLREAACMQLAWAAETHQEPEAEPEPATPLSSPDTMVTTMLDIMCGPGTWSGEPSSGSGGVTKVSQFHPTAPTDTTQLGSQPNDDWIDVKMKVSTKKRKPDVEATDHAEEVMRTYKTEECKGCSDRHQCLHWHYANERRRDPRIHLYEAAACPYGNECTDGDACTFAHGNGEVMFHPDNYRTHRCQRDPCHRPWCAFAHSDVERRRREVGTEPSLVHHDQVALPDVASRQDQAGQSRLHSEALQNLEGSQPLQQSAIHTKLFETAAVPVVDFQHVQVEQQALRNMVRNESAAESLHRHKAVKVTRAWELPKPEPEPEPEHDDTVSNDAGQTTIQLRVAALADMGFADADCKRALEITGQDLGLAADLLLTGQISAPSPQTIASTGSEVPRTWELQPEPEPEPEPPKSKKALKRARQKAKAAAAKAATDAKYKATVSALPAETSQAAQRQDRYGALKVKTEVHNVPQPPEDSEPESDDGDNQHLVGAQTQEGVDTTVRQTLMADNVGTWAEVKRKKKPRAPRPVNSVSIADDVMTTYKTCKCANVLPHDWIACPDWHGPMDQRRCPFQHHYEPAMCPDAADCARGVHCQFAHNQPEQMFHPQNYRTSVCKRRKACKFPFCAFAHTDEERRQPEYSRPAAHTQPGLMRSQLEPQPDFGMAVGPLSRPAPWRQGQAVPAFPSLGEAAVRDERLHLAKLEAKLEAERKGLESQMKRKMEEQLHAKAKIHEDMLRNQRTEMQKLEKRIDFEHVQSEEQARNKLAVEKLARQKAEHSLAEAARKAGMREAELEKLKKERVDKEAMAQAVKEAEEWRHSAIVAEEKRRREDAEERLMLIERQAKAESEAKTAEVVREAQRRAEISDELESMREADDRGAALAQQKSREIAELRQQMAAKAAEAAAKAAEAARDADLMQMELESQLETMQRELEQAQKSTPQSVGQGTTIARWECEIDGGKWAAYSDVISEALEQAYAVRKATTFERGSWTYSVEFVGADAGKQTNTQTKARRSMRRRVETVGTASKTIVDSGASPDTWTPNPPGQNCHLVSVAVDSLEWLDIERRVHETSPTATLTRVHRIQNEALWRLYQTRRDEMQRMLGEPPLELEVWHGTGTTNPEKIYKDKQDGFMMQLSRPGMWGKGIYFADKFSYSAEANGGRYAFQTGDEKQVMFVKLLAGAVEVMDPNRDLKHPPDKQDGSETRFDSVQGNTCGSDVYIVYENRRAYPQYRVQFHTQ